MSGHNPWPPGQIHDDLQRGKREVFRFGDWSIYDATADQRWNSFIMHCRAWKEWEKVIHHPATTGVKGVYVDNVDRTYSILQEKRCNANMTAENCSHCVECGIKIPDEVVALWKLQNFDKIQEFNSE